MCIHQKIKCCYMVIQTLRKKLINWLELLSENSLRVRWKDFSHKFTTLEQTGRTVNTELANIVCNVIINPIKKEKLVQKLEIHLLWAKNLKKLKNVALKSAVICFIPKYCLKILKYGNYRAMF